MNKINENNALLGLYVEAFYHILNTPEDIYRDHFIN